MRDALADEGRSIALTEFVSIAVQLGEMQMTEEVSKSREERLRELHRMPKDQLWRIYRQYMTPGSTGAIGDMMIAAILESEFDRQRPKPGLE